VTAAYDDWPPPPDEPPDDDPWGGYNTEAVAQEVAGDSLNDHGQVRLAHRLAAREQGRLLHVHGLGWHRWDGARWTPDDGGFAKRAVIETLRDEWTKAFGDKALAREVKACSNASAVRGILDIAAALKPFAATVEDLDADVYLLNVANGTLDLRTLELRPHDPADRITKVTTAAYRPDARSDLWTGFLERILPDADVRDYLQRFLGVALLGRVVEQVFTIALGTGANGKSVSYEALLHALGDYGHTGESDLFMAAKSNANSASPAVAALRGKRFVVTSETEQGHKLATALMKSLTGGDPITARQLYRDPVTFIPSHTVLLVSNHLPMVAADDPAVWRRMRVVPFDVVIPAQEQDGRLGEKLQLEADAILTWAVEGYRQYEVQGLAAPEAVQAATAEYQKASDAIARFIEDRCLVGPHWTVPAGELYEAWVKWSIEDGADPVAKKQFGAEMDKRGFKDKRTNTHRLRTGITLAGDDDEL